MTIWSRKVLAQPMPHPAVRESSSYSASFSPFEGEAIDKDSSSSAVSFITRSGACNKTSVFVNLRWTYFETFWVTKRIIILRTNWWLFNSLCTQQFSSWALKLPLRRHPLLTKDWMHKLLRNCKQIVISQVLTNLLFSVDTLNFSTRSK